jgi:hypothetical protein
VLTDLGIKRNSSSSVFQGICAKKTLRLHYQGHSVNAVEVIITVYSDNRSELMHTLCG